MTIFDVLDISIEPKDLKQSSTGCPRQHKEFTSYNTQLFPHQIHSSSSPFVFML